MPRLAKTSTADQLQSLITRLQAQRREHEAAIAAIDTTFARFGISAAPARKGRGRPRTAVRIGRSRKTVKKAGRPRRAGRRQFATTAEQSILALVKAAGTKGATGAEIVKHWKSEGRKAGAYNAIGRLVNEKKLKKAKIQGGQGSRYTAM